MDLRKFMSMMIYYQHNMKILHWCYKGECFDTYHELANEYYTTFQDYIDTIAEMAMSCDLRPVSLPEAYKILSEDDGDYRILTTTVDYDKDTFLENTNIMFTEILKALDKLYDDDCIESSPGNASKLDTMYAYCELELKYKNKRR